MQNKKAGELEGQEFNPLKFLIIQNQELRDARDYGFDKGVQTEKKRVEKMLHFHVETLVDRIRRSRKIKRYYYLTKKQRLELEREIMSLKIAINEIANIAKRLGIDSYKKMYLPPLPTP